MSSALRGKYSDLKISEADDLLFGNDGLEVLTCDLDSIIQDIRHLIRESRYLVDMVGERDEERRWLLLQQLIMEVEEDYRIVPGSVVITDDGSLRHWTLQASTYEFGNFSQKLETD